MHFLDSLQNLITSIFGFLVAAGYIAWRLKRSYDVSEAEAAERRASRESFEQLKRDPHFLHLQRHLHTKYRTAFERGPDATTYCIRYIALMSEKYERLFAHEGARAATSSPISNGATTPRASRPRSTSEAVSVRRWRWPGSAGTASSRSCTDTRNPFIHETPP